MIQKTLLLTILFLLIQCNYIGGYDIMSGKKVKEKVAKRVSSYGPLGTLYLLSAADSASSFSCPGDSTTTVNETESNDTFKTANEVSFPTSEKDTRIKGEISSSSDIDIFYMVVPSEYASKTIYVKNPSGYCTEYISTSEELNNDTTTSLYSTSSATFSDGGTTLGSSNYNYYFLVCEVSKISNTIDITFSLSDITDSSSSSSSSSTNIDFNLITAIGYLGVDIFAETANVEDGKKYTKSSVEDCLDKIDSIAPALQIINTNSLITASYCGSKYVYIDPYWVSGRECKIEPAEFIQIGSIP